MATLSETKIKIVAIFESNKSRNAIVNFLTNTIWANLEPKIDTLMNDNFSSWSKVISLRVIETSPSNWEVYPKFAISGETDLTQTQLVNGVSNLLKELKDQMKIDIITQNVSNLKFYVAYPDQRNLEADDVDSYAHMNPEAI